MKTQEEIKAEIERLAEEDGAFSYSDTYPYKGVCEEDVEVFSYERTIQTLQKFADWLLS